MSWDAQRADLELSTKTRLRLWLRLLKATRVVEAGIKERLRTEFGSTLPRFDVMAALYEYPKGLRMSELSGVLKVSNGNVTGIVDRLVNDGVVVRSPVPGDRRALLVHLTKKGQEEFESQALSHEMWVDDMLSEISLNDASQMIATLESLAAMRNDADYRAANV